MYGQMGIEWAWLSQTIISGLACRLPWRLQWYPGDVAIKEKLTISKIKKIPPNYWLILMWLMFLFIKIIITFSIEECFLIETMLLVHNPICYVIMAFNSKFVVVMLHLKRRQHLVLKYSVFTTVFGAKSNMWNVIFYTTWPQYHRNPHTRPGRETIAPLRQSWN